MPYSCSNKHSCVQYLPFPEFSKTSINQAYVQYLHQQNKMSPMIESLRNSRHFIAIIAQILQPIYTNNALTYATLVTSYTQHSHHSCLEIHCSIETNIIAIVNLAEKERFLRGINNHIHNF